MSAHFSHPSDREADVRLSRLAAAMTAEMQLGWAGLSLNHLAFVLLAKWEMLYNSD